MTVCPICQKPVVSEVGTGPFPFCSSRCKKLDLYRWLNEEYRFSEPVSPESCLLADGESELNDGGDPI